MLNYAVIPYKFLFILKKFQAKSKGDDSNDRPFDSSSTTGLAQADGAIGTLKIPCQFFGCNAVAVRCILQ